jgi:hypothetical protein
MKIIQFVVLVLLSNFSFGQNQKSISIIDFVKIKNYKRQETIFYYENNWKLHRDVAIEKGYIQSYKLLTTTADTAANFDLILITEYADSLQFKLREERFQEIIKMNRPDGPKLLNELKPSDFRINLFFRQTETLFHSEKKQTN